MHIQLNTNEGITGDERMVERVEAEVMDALGHFEDQISTVEVYLSDANGAKHGADDKICVIEARANGRKPMAVKHQADTIAEAITVAAEKMEHRLEHDLGRQNHHKGGETLRRGFDETEV